mmetsp:Transcript_5188/g.5317  ORF Transcript_5188/g.5317 Transcript_5188/m.5317 type:complete len:499 (+) Transcript_5188:2-1498(+)
MTGTTQASRILAMFKTQIRYTPLSRDLTGEFNSSPLPYLDSHLSLSHPSHSPVRPSPGRRVSYSGAGEHASPSGKDQERMRVSRSEELLNASDTSVNSRPITNSVEREASKFDVIKRFEAPVSLTPTSRWLNGLGHISDESQKFWRGSSPPENELLGYGISPMPVPFPSQYQSRQHSNSSDAGFALEDLEQAVIQAQKDDRKRAEQMRLTKKKQEEEKNDRIKVMSLEREKGLERERERLRRLESDKRIKHPEDSTGQQSYQQPVQTSDRTPLKSASTGLTATAPWDTGNTSKRPPDTTLGTSSATLQESTHSASNTLTQGKPPGRANMGYGAVTSSASVVQPPVMRPAATRPGGSDRSLRLLHEMNENQGQGQGQRQSAMTAGYTVSEHLLQPQQLPPQHERGHEYRGNPVQCSPMIGRNDHIIHGNRQTRERSSRENGSDGQSSAPLTVDVTLEQRRSALERHGSNAMISPVDDESNMYNTNSHDHNFNRTGADGP